MPRLLFQKTGNAIWISHLDLMRVFQRAFKRAGLLLTHTQGYNPRPSVSIAMPLSVGIESNCELLDFELYGDEIPCEEICERLNAALIDGVNVLSVYKNGSKIKNLAYLACKVLLEYDAGVPNDAAGQIRSLFSRQEIIVEKKNKNGVKEENIIPMIHSFDVEELDAALIIRAVVSCQNPTLNPMQLNAAIEKYLPELKSDFVKFSREEIYDSNNEIFR